MKKDSPAIDLSYGSHGTLKNYTLGFVLSLILTLITFFLVQEKILQGNTLIFTIAGLALVQAILQLVFFLHLGEEQEPYWNFVLFLFMVLVLLIVVLGTLWIMFNLDYRMMNQMPME